VVTSWARRTALLLVIVLLLSSACTRSRPTTTSATASIAGTVTATPIGLGATVTGQTIYVPVYSHIYYQDRERVINLTVTLSVRNADPQHPIQIDSVQYYDAKGQLVRNELTAPQPLAPLAALNFVVDEDDTTGGTSASFLVQWRSAAQAMPPVVEAVMISAASTQGISFVTVGRVIEEFSPPAGAPTAPVTATE
jgi:hypothetical protein